MIKVHRKEKKNMNITERFGGGKNKPTYIVIEDWLIESAQNGQASYKMYEQNTVRIQYNNGNENVWT